jgi:hypothetical protein
MGLVELKGTSFEQRDSYPAFGEPVWWSGLACHSHRLYKIYIDKAPSMKDVA